MKTDMALLGDYQIRRIYDEDEETWWFSVVVIIRFQARLDDYQTVSKYWNKIKQYLKKGGNQSVTNCHRLKFLAADGKAPKTDKPPEGKR